MSVNVAEPKLARVGCADAHGRGELLDPLCGGGQTVVGECPTRIVPWHRDVTDRKLPLARRLLGDGGLHLVTGRDLPDGHRRLGIELVPGVVSRLTAFGQLHRAGLDDGAGRRGPPSIPIQVADAPLYCVACTVGTTQSPVMAVKVVPVAIWPDQLVDSDAYELPATCGWGPESGNHRGRSGTAPAR